MGLDLRGDRDMDSSNSHLGSPHPLSNLNRKKLRQSRLFSSWALEGSGETVSTPNQCNSLICNRSRGLHFTLGLQFGIAVLRGFFTNMRFISLSFTGFERKSQMGRNRT